MKRIREQIQMYGVQTLSNPELLAYILGNHTSTQDAQEAASKLLETYSLGQLQSADWADFVSLAGLSKTQAQRLNVVCELARRLGAAESGQRTQVKSSADAAMLFKPLMMNLDHEEFRILLLDTKNFVIANILAYSGTANSSVLRSAEIFKPAIARNCPSIIIAHNHPSAEPTPSPEDLEVTEQLVASGKLLDIEVLDHLIIGNPRYVSLKQHLQW
jgi:DNA repair protein RadC